MTQQSSKQKFVIFIFGISLIILPLLVLAVFIASDPRSKANPKAQPKEVIFSNISANSITVSYVTEEAVPGYVSATRQGPPANGTDIRDSESKGKYKAHYIIVTGMQPSKEYNIEIYSDDQKFTDGAWKIKTPAVNEQIGVPSPVRGKINAEGSVDEGLVYAMAGNTSGNSKITSFLVTSESNNTFVLDRNSMVGDDGKKVSMDGKDVLVYINALDSGKAKAQISSDSDTFGEIKLTDANISFSSNEKITPGAGPDLITEEEEEEPESYPTDGFTIDDFSESLLTETFSSGSEIEHPYAPFDIFISNISQSGFTVNWRTKKPSIGYIEVLEESQKSKIVDPRDGSIDNAKKRFTHSAEASSGSIPGGTIFEFQIVSEGIEFGENIDEIVNDYNLQFKAYAQKYFSKNKETQASSSPREALENNLDQIPEFQYGLNSKEYFDEDQLEELEVNEEDFDKEIEIEPFKVIIPAAPDSPPLPLAFQGNLSSIVTEKDYMDALKSVSNKTEIDLDNIDVSKDVIVAVKTNKGTWSSASATDSLGFSISIGSQLTQDKKKYVEVESGDDLQVVAYGFLNQKTKQSLGFSDDIVNIKLENPIELISVDHTEIIEKPVIFGFIAPNQTGEVSFNDKISNITGDADGKWSLKDTKMETGLNKVEFVSGEEALGMLFIVDVPELPVTGIREDITILFFGIFILMIGILIMKKYQK